MSAIAPATHGPSKVAANAMSRPLLETQTSFAELLDRPEYAQLRARTTFAFGALGMFGHGAMPPDGESRTVSGRCISQEPELSLSAPSGTEGRALFPVEGRHDEWAAHSSGQAADIPVRRISELSATSLFGPAESTPGLPNVAPVPSERMTGDEPSEPAPRGSARWSADARSGHTQAAFELSLNVSSDRAAIVARAGREMSKADRLRLRQAVEESLRRHGLRLADFHLDGISQESKHYVRTGGAYGDIQR